MGVDGKLTMRNCYICNSIIRECMGSVHAGSFMARLLSGDLTVPIYELCPKCASFYANIVTDGGCYPQPGGYHADYQ